MEVTSVNPNQNHFLLKKMMTDKEAYFCHDLSVITISINLI
jgi:hypothetical protein